MQWLPYAIAAGLALAAADVLIKAVAGKIPNSLGMLLYGVAPFAIGAIWAIADGARWAKQSPSWNYIAAGAAVGLMFSAVTFCMYAAFKQGAPISVASPLIRLGGLIIASLAGALIWKEPITARYLAGLGLSVAGLYLIASK